MATALAETSTVFNLEATAVEIRMVAKVAIACLTLEQVSKSKIGVGSAKTVIAFRKC